MNGRLDALVVGARSHPAIRDSSEPPHPWPQLLGPVNQSEQPPGEERVAAALQLLTQHLEQPFLRRARHLALASARSGRLVGWVRYRRHRRSSGTASLT